MDALGLGRLSYGAFFLVFASIFAVIVLGLNLQWGFTGLFNVGVAGFVAVGAYTSALLTTPETPDRSAASAGRWRRLAGGDGHLGAGRRCWWARRRCGCARLPGHHHLRHRGDDAAGGAQRAGLTGGPFGVQFIPKPLQGWLGTGTAWNLAYLALVAAAAGARLRGAGAPGAQPLGPRAARHPRGRGRRRVAGQARLRFRLQSFVIGSMLMGLGGALYAHFVGYIAPEDFLPILTFQLWAMLIVGGSGNNRGAVLGAFVVWGFWAAPARCCAAGIPQAEQARAAALQVVLIGVLIALMLVLRPRGLLGEALRSACQHLRHRQQAVGDVGRQPGDGAVRWLRVRA
jgi:branched-chain amino acid transport system permease protein